MSPKIALFVADVFRYLKYGAARDSIRSVVLREIEAAARDVHEASEKLVLVGHSMGAVIL